MMFRRYFSSAMLAATLFVMLPATAATPDIEEIWQLLQSQQAQINELKSKLNESQARLEEAQQRLAADTASQATRLAEAETAIEVTADAVDLAAAPAASRTTIGGYGELHYNDLDNGEQIDLHRFVLLFSHQFNEDLTFHSEFEVEHSLAGEGKPGEVEIEQAFVQWGFAENHYSKMGLFLVPVGILNETHEPDTFYGVERNAVEKNIIPATWWEAGVSVSGEIAPGWGYDVAVHSGLNLDTSNTSAAKRTSIRSARQKVAEANGDSLAYTARLRFGGISGLQWNTTLQYQTDLTQDDDDAVGIGELSATLFETDLNYERDGFGLRALYARWDIDNEIELLNPGADEQEGWYIEPSYTFENGLGLFMRYGGYDLTAGSGATSDERNQFDFGVNYWLHDNVVIKADYQRQDNDNGTDIDGFNLGVGYSF